MKSLRVLAVCLPEQLPPDSLEGLSEKQIYERKTEWDVFNAIRQNGHELRPLGVKNELAPLREQIETWKPDIVFNLLDEFHGQTVYCQNVASFLELMRVPYTGCNPRGMMLSQGKDLSKKLLKYHRIPTPAFAVFPRGRKVKRPGRLAFPLIVKSTTEDSSFGIAQASVVESDEKLEERVHYIHDAIGTAAIAEQYIHGRELYVGVVGNERLTVLPVWELEFNGLPARALPIATENVKHNLDYQKKRGITQRAADLSPQLSARIRDYVRRICRILELDGYNRIDFRLGTDGVPYFIEANPNPDIAESEELAQSAIHDGLTYPELINRMLALGLQRANASED